MSLHCFLFISLFVIAVSQDLRPVYLKPTNLTNERVNLENAETRQSDIWLLSSNGPVPAELNRGWSPENGYPGVQTVTSLHRGAFGYRLRGSQSPIGHMQDRSEQPENTGEVLIFTPEVQNIGERNAAAPTRPNLETTFLNIQDPESVLVELPVELSSGFWERPRPQIIQEISSSGRRVISADGPGTIQFDSATTSHVQQETPQEVFSPNREATSRLPIPSLQPVNDNASGRETAVYEIPYQTSDAALANLSNQSSYVPQTNREDIWFPIQGRTPTRSSEVLGGNDDRLLYQISFEAPTQTSAQDNVGLTLTPDDIEILERLGILSSLTLEDVDSSNRTQSPLVENSQREYESAPHPIDHGGQNYEIVHDGMYGTNLSDIVFIEIPEFTSSQYHGNIPDNSEQTDRVRPIPYAIEDSSVNTDSDSNNATSSPVFNGTSLTSEQIQEILQFLGLDNPTFSNETAITTEKLQSDSETTTNAIPETTQSLETSASFGNKDTKRIDNNNFTTSNNSTAKEFLQEVEETPSTTTLEDRTTSSAGLVSSGRIQPRILERISHEGSETENEVLGLISRRMSPISSQKLEMLRKLMIKPKPYVFGYLQNDGNGTVQHRDETADGSGSIKGHYGYRDAWGVYRNVSYIADGNGFHAVVKTNEPGTVSHNPADAVIMSELPPQAAIAQMMAYLNRNNSFSTSTR